MRGKDCLGVTRTAAVSVMACLALLCMPTMSSAAAPSDSRAGAADRSSAQLARGSGYGQPGGSPQVRTLQRKLRAEGHQPGPVDGLYGPLTEAAVERVQRDSGVSVDGIVGPQTRRVLNAEAPPLAPGAGYGQPGGSPQVREVQRRLRALGQRPGPVDGRFGPRTQAAIERFQRAAGEHPSGELSLATAAAIARTRPDQRPRRASDRRGANKPSQQAQRPASRAAGSGANDRASRTDGGSPTVVSEESRTPTAGDSRIDEKDGSDLSASVLLVPLLLAAGAVGVLIAGWLMATRRRPGSSGAVRHPRTATPIPTGSRHAATATAGQGNGVDALGYVDAREPEAVHGPELRDQMAAIYTACSQRGLVLDEVITDVGQVDDTRPGRRGLQSALQRLAAGEASCLVVPELGQLSRSAPEVDHIVDWLQRQDTRLVAVDDGLDTGTRAGSGTANGSSSPARPTS